VSESKEQTLADGLVSTDSMGSDGYEPESAIGPGTLIGRYVVLSLLGRGGMGVVVAAYDPELDRKVALKLLRPRGGSASAATARLQREAQALAKLDHPNVVGVHDVGSHDDKLFVAMDFVDGQTLGDWLAARNQQPRAWQEVVKVFVEAGRGLAAAHEAGLVHRDFKPDNVMIGDDGRVRVMDFGLARPESGEDAQPPERPSVTSTSATIDRLTQTGTMLGTPAYMSLEQFEGRTIDARSDQFSFCVALYEGLYGQRPFAGRSIAQIAASVEHGQIQDAPRGASVPAWLRRVVVRGLAQAPEQRWPSMRELLSALTHDPAVRRRKGFAVAGVLGLLAAAATGVVFAVQRDAQICTGMDAKLDGIWDAQRRAQIEAALLGTGLVHAPATWSRVEQRLDDYADAWVAARTEACEATHRGEQSGMLLDLRMACLDGRLDHLHAAVDVLAHADATVAGQAVSLVAALPTLDRCSDLEALTAEMPPPDDPGTAEQVATLEHTLVDARALEQAGKYVEAIALADAVVAASTTLGYKPLWARALWRQGSLQERLGDYARAEATLEQAYASALSQGMLSEASSLSVALMFLVGDTLARTDEGLRWAVHADALSLAVHSDDSRAVYLNTRGALANVSGAYDDARAYYDDARVLFERALGPESTSVAGTLHNLGNIAVEQGQLEQGRAYHGRALAIFETAVGPDHPDVAGCLVNRANIDIQLGALDQARNDLERSLDILEAALGPEHVEVATSLNGLGGVAQMQGDLETARGYYQRTRTILEATLGPVHPHVATVCINLGAVAAGLGELDEARRQYEHALAIREAALGPEHPDVAAALDELGYLALDEHREADASALFDRALTIHLATHGPDHLDIADTRFALARALWSSDPTRARELAELARRTYAARTPAPKQLAELDAYLFATASKTD
jgi:tetratricopeptide (TPR) repeat protein/predicted Ser/Thr protein kinase